MNKRKLAYYFLYWIIILGAMSFLGYFSVAILIYILKGLGISGSSLALLVLVPIPLYIYVFIRLRRFLQTLKVKWLKE
jgi:hypothetical protein